ncbi:hypothetical protein A3C89_00315 [Candidatus Kaiserbacteria bacterium RIFCSPHIGHO2_02_FULL_50_50]|uniref:Uncharacterized protein n=1 Tax=Candidatus Kaiserbacteria bacterium RIFCSPHIGHO2_02_FULL_50_50 TaxID=1798492 RepID=A0A1F6DE48_9BACT|nr:MAG: hypothetical protein A3C89_00315 [Candidatus Kaiserbacteria bacterium RIFCSPHIGHO2_02_FULL_50_50]OGG89188.1 MAG: hypothetical protein A3G62_00995 [Candidatus Kaiserbacteria bacterium RIFCSPLOWO2_12_FULL_50_10]
MRTTTHTTILSWQAVVTTWLYALCGAQLYMMMLARLFGGVWFPPVFSFLEVTEPVLTATFFTALIIAYRFDTQAARRRMTMLGFACGCLLIVIANMNYRLTIFAPSPLIGYFYVVVSILGAVFLLTTFIAYRRMILQYRRRQFKKTVL